jgi:hypothetical protein
MECTDIRPSACNLDVCKILKIESHQLLSNTHSGWLCTLSLRVLVSGLMTVMNTFVNPGCSLWNGKCLYQIYVVNHCTITYGQSCSPTDCFCWYTHSYPLNCGSRYQKWLHKSQRVKVSSKKLGAWWTGVPCSDGRPPRQSGRHWRRSRFLQFLLTSDWPSDCHATSK